jgi:uncharacterized Zn finger protein
MGHAEQSESRTQDPLTPRSRRRRRVRTSGDGAGGQPPAGPSRPQSAREKPGSKVRRTTVTKRKPTGRGRSPIRLSTRARASAEFGANWWARRWITALERMGWAARLERGRDYARRGNVLDLDVRPGEVVARVQGSKPHPYTATISLQKLDDDQWDRVVKRLGRQALYAAKLLAGDMPPNIEDIFNAVDVQLIPKSSGAFDMNCTCPDPVTPCKHIAAVHYVLAAEFDRDPFVLFELRGRTRQDIVRSLQGRSGEQTFDTLPFVPMEEAESERTLENFWRGSPHLSDIHVRITRPTVEGGLLKRLGPLPLRGQSDDWRSQLQDAYRLVSRQAFALGRGDEVDADESVT